MDSKQKTLAIGATAALLALGGLYMAWNSLTGKVTTPEATASPDPKEPHTEEIKTEAEEQCPAGSFRDPKHAGQKYITKVEAFNRSEIISNVNYVIALGLRKRGKTFHGRICVEFDLSQKAAADFDPSKEDNSGALFIDYKGKYIHKLVVNNQAIEGDVEGKFWNAHRLYIPRSH